MLPSGSKSSFQMRASFVFHLETKVLESGGRVEEGNSLEERNKKKGLMICKPKSYRFCGMNIRKQEQRNAR